MRVEDIEWFAVRHREWIDAWMGGVAMARAEYGAWDPVADDDMRTVVRPCGVMPMISTSIR